MYIPKLLAAVIIGVFLSTRDFREGRILNKEVLLVFFAGLVLNLLEFGTMPSTDIFVNLILSLLIGYALWKMGIWSAGDGKLFTAYSLFLPAQAYSSFFPSQYLLYNVFLISFFIWLPSLLWKTTAEQKKGAFIVAFGKKSVANMVLILFGVFWALGKFFRYLGVDVLVFYLIAAFLIFYLVRTAFPKGVTAFMAVVAMLRLVLDASVYSLQFVLNFALVALGILFAYALGLLSHHISFDVRLLKDLREGDLPFGIVKRKGSKKEVDFNQFMRRHFGIRGQDIAKVGFGQEDVVRAGKLGALVGGFVVKKRVAFVPLLSAALVLTILLGGDVFLYAVSALYRFFE